MATEFEILQALTQDHVNGLPGVVLTTFNDEGLDLHHSIVLSEE